MNVHCLNKTGENLSVPETGGNGLLNGIETNVSAVDFAMYIVPMVLSIELMTAFLKWTETHVRDAAFAIENAGLELSAWSRRSRYG